VRDALGLIAGAGPGDGVRCHLDPDDHHDRPHDRDHGGADHHDRGYRQADLDDGDNPDQPLLPR